MVNFGKIALFYISRDLNRVKGAMLFERIHSTTSIDTAHKV